MSDEFSASRRNRSSLSCRVVAFWRAGPSAAWCLARTAHGAKLGGIERLDDVIGRAQLQALELFLARRGSGEEDDGNIRRGGVCLELTTNFKAVVSWKIHVEQNQIRAQAQDRVQSLLPV